MTTALELGAAGMLCGFVFFVWPPLILLVLAIFFGVIAWRTEASK